MKNRLEEVMSYYQNGDLSLALRRVTDYTLDSENSTLFRKCLALHDAFENKEKQDEPIFDTLYKQLIEGLDQVSLPELKENKVLLQTHKLGKHYRYGGFGLKNIDTQLTQGEVVGLVGENGNGKTTLLRLIGGELAPTTGKIDYPFTDKPSGSYDFRSSIVYVPQRITKWYGSLMENLMFTNALYQRKGIENELWAEMMVARLGLRPYKHLNWNRISSGYKTRFEIARVLLQRPAMLLLDEPLANLDIFAQQTLLNDLRYRAQSLRSPFGIILSSQQLYEVEKISDKVIFLKNGAPKYQSFTKESQDKDELDRGVSVFEIESNASHEEMNKILGNMALREVKYNGGAYIITIDGNVGSNYVLKELGSSDLEIQSFRNITHSTRRFFDS